MGQRPLLDILHSDGADSIVLANPDTHDDVAEIFHRDRHTVPQTVEDALATARMFAASGKLFSALQELLVVAGTPITDRQSSIVAQARAALAAAKPELAK